MKNIKRILLALAVAIIATSCSVVKIAKSYDQLDFLGITNVSMKGITGVQVTCRLSNSSKYNYVIENSHIKLMHNGETIAWLTQIGQTTAYAHGTNLSHSTWKIEKIDPINTILLTARAAKMDFSGMTLDAGLTIRVDGSKLKLSRKNIDVEKLMAE